MNPYEELGVAKDADAATIKRARRKLARKLHPDRNPNSAAKMALVNVAFDILMDPKRRAHYDQTGEHRQPTVEEHARKLVLQGFLQYSQEKRKTNIPKRVIESLERALETYEGQKRDGMNALAHFEGKLGDVKTSDSTDLWRGVIEQQIAGAKSKLELLEQERAAVVMAIEIAKRYRSTVREQPAEQPAGMTFFTVG